MKPGSLLIAAFLASAPFCQAQDKAPADPPAVQDATKPAAQDAIAPAKSETITPAAQDADKTATQDTTKLTAPDATKPARSDNTTPPIQDANKSAVPDSYVIDAPDSIGIFVWKETDLSIKDIMVRPDGMISIPLLGDVKASGKTPLQLAAEIADKLKKYIQDPNVTVTVNGMNSKKVYLIGEVARTGPIQLTPGMTLLEAITTAGGVTPYANSKKIYILRNEAGNHLKIPVQYKQALKGYGSFNIALNPGDTIVVP